MSRRLDLILLWGRLFRHALADGFTRPALHYFALAMAALSAAATAFGLQDVIARGDDHARLLQQQTRAQVRETPLSGWEADERLRALRAPEAGAALVGGLEVVVPGYWDFAPSGVEWGSGHRPARMSEGGLTLDLAGLVLTLGGLAASLLGAYLTLAKRTDGTWFVLLNLPVRTSLVGTPALLALFVGGLYPAVAACSAAALTVLASSAPSLAASKDNVVAMAITLIGPAWIYLSLMGLLGVGLAIAARREGTAFLYAIGAWAAIALLLPAVPLASSHLLSQTASRNAMEFNRSQAYATTLRDAEIGLGDFVLAQTGGTDDPQAFQAFLAGHPEPIKALWDKEAARARRAADDIDRVWLRSRAQDERVVFWVALLSPGFQLIRAMEALTNTGPTAAHSWHNAVQSHQEVLTTVLFDDRPRIGLRVRPVADNVSYVYSVDRREAQTLGDMPAFQAPVRTIAGRVRAAAWPTMVLAVYAVGAGVWVCLLFTRVARTTHSLEASSPRP